ncbi:ATP/GTP-binding protein [Xylophilus sp. Leaf220]|uniref:AAA family ATPase n=1 Tax=Xylophilus sp. Leaf220 TaxID=1735686 RepID=UPI0014440157|nr:ATP-binding protein [Xylophilus sp. Leaf220]
MRDKADMSFVAAPFKEHAEAKLECRFTPHGVLPIMAVYGANASGKSNALRALHYIRHFVITSFRTAEQAGTGRKAFRLDAGSEEENSLFEIDFVIDDVRFELGFELDDKKVVREWLNQYPNKIRQKLYERSEQFFEYGRALTGPNKQIESVTLPNVLFLSAAAASKHPILEKISEFFKEKLFFRFSNGVSPAEFDEIGESLFRNEDLKNDVVRLLRFADTGIRDLKITEEEIPADAKSGIASLVELIQKLAGPAFPPELKFSKTHTYKISVGHECGDDKVRHLSLATESLGTQYLLQLLPSLLVALNLGAVIILDEITTALHTLLARKIVSMFNNKALNKHGAQLIFTTHDTNLLYPGLLRRDEIWFAEKSSEGATVIYPLSDIKTKNSDNIEKGYVEGRFGAIPFVSEFSL